jgi:hypothetical protein
MSSKKPRVHLPGGEQEEHAEHAEGEAETKCRDHEVSILRS